MVWIPIPRWACGIYSSQSIYCALVYVLGFARKIKLWQNVVIYIVMFVGCIMLTFFGAFLPVAESLAVAAVVLGLYRFRLHQERKAGNIKPSKICNNGSRSPLCARFF